MSGLDRVLHDSGRAAAAGSEAGGRALLLIDFINDLDFPGGERLLAPALAAARHAAALRRSARGAQVPVIYVNDNFRRWRSDFRQVIDHCAAPGSRGRELVAILAPDEADYFVLKPRNSGFFQTPLALLLQDLGVRHLLLAGLTTENCVLYTASDAYLQDFSLHVAAEAVASIEAEDKAHALHHMGTVLKARVLHAGDRHFFRSGPAGNRAADRAVSRAGE